MSTTKTTKLYKPNQAVYNKALQLLKAKNFTSFKSQNALFIFMEDIKNPFLKQHREELNSKSPAYMPVNYMPVIDKLVENGILMPVKGTYRKTYYVNTEKLKNTLASE